jgi:hypothetical protein
MAAHPTPAIESVDGYKLPEAGQRAVYWKDYDYTDVFAADTFRPSVFEDQDVEILSPR